jgi:hypothetical protein
MTERNDHQEEVTPTITGEVLQPVVRQVLSSKDSEVVDWKCHNVKGGIGGGQLVRITGTATNRGDDQLWSVFLKVLRRGAEPERMNFAPDGWKREALAYQSGVLSDLVGGMEAAVCYHIDARSDTEMWMWFEDLSGETDTPWSLDRYGLAARHLGQLNGHYLNEPSLPASPWQFDAFDLQAVKRDGSIEDFRSEKDDPLIQRLVPPARHSMIFHLWEKRESYLAKLYDRLPQTFGHMDAGRFNLFSRVGSDGQPATVAIDWAQIGVAPIGKEIKPLAVNSVAWGYVEEELAPELDQIVFHGYIDGLRDMGWSGDPRLARYGYTMLMAMHLLRGALPTKERLVDYSDERLERRTELWSFILDLVAEGLELDRTLF